MGVIYTPQLIDFTEPKKATLPFPNSLKKLPLPQNYYLIPATRMRQCSEEFDSLKYLLLLEHQPRPFRDIH